MNDGSRQPPGAAVVPIPGDAEFLRVTDGIRGGDDPIVPVAASAARPGDIVLLSDRRIGIYQGGGMMLLEDEPPKRDSLS